MQALLLGLTRRQRVGSLLLLLQKKKSSIHATFDNIHKQPVILDHFAERELSERYSHSAKISQYFQIPKKTVAQTHTLWLTLDV